jgi:hypothetical protein
MVHPQKERDLEDNRVTYKRFGMIAVERAYVTRDQVLEALRIQVQENLLDGMHRQIGAILFDQGQMDREQIQTVLSELTRSANLTV